MHWLPRPNWLTIVHYPANHSFAILVYRLLRCHRRSALFASGNPPGIRHFPLSRLSIGRGIRGSWDTMFSTPATYMLIWQDVVQPSGRFSCIRVDSQPRSAVIHTPDSDSFGDCTRY